MLPASRRKKSSSGVAGSMNSVRRLACGRTMGSRSSSGKASALRTSSQRSLPGGNVPPSVRVWPGASVRDASGPAAPSTSMMPGARLRGSGMIFHERAPVFRRRRSRRSSRSCRWDGRRREVRTPSGTSVRRSVTKRVMPASRARLRAALSAGWKSCVPRCGFQPASGGEEGVEIVPGVERGPGGVGFEQPPLGLRGGARESRNRAARVRASSSRNASIETELSSTTTTRWLESRRSQRGPASSHVSSTTAASCSHSGTRIAQALQTPSLRADRAERVEQEERAREDPPRFALEEMDRQHGGQRQQRPEPGGIGERSGAS